MVEFKITEDVLGDKVGMYFNRFVVGFFSPDYHLDPGVSLSYKGTPFRIKVWERLPDSKFVVSQITQDQHSYVPLNLLRGGEVWETTEESVKKKMINEFQGEYRWLSNFWPVEVRYGTDVFPSVEHAYQAAKNPADEKHYNDCLAAKTAGEAKKLGKKTKLRDDWEQIKLLVMEGLLRDKFSHPELAEKLKATGDQELIEGNYWGDTFWGVCRGNGENNLGKLLMKIRNEL